MAEYDSGYTARFYDVYGVLGWERLEGTPYGRLQATTNADFIERFVKLGDRIPDAGCSPGRFAAATARLGTDGPRYLGTSVGTCESRSTGGLIALK
ncbi:MAG: hypothetical protein OXH22_04740 [Chloroflexi bacterium]|nr:hypothetical protein [Chloroflexota bacterium]